MQSNGVHLHEVESTGIHYNLLEAPPADAPGEAELLRIVTPRPTSLEEEAPEPVSGQPDTGYQEVLDLLQTLEVHAWEAKKRCEVLQDMVEDVADGTTVEPSHREPLLETAKTLCTDLQDLYRMIRVTLKTQTPDYHTAVWKKSSRSRK